MKIKVTYTEVDDFVEMDSIDDFEIDWRKMSAIIVAVLLFASLIIAIV